MSRRPDGLIEVVKISRDRVRVYTLNITPYLELCALPYRRVIHVRASCMHFLLNVYSSQ